MSKEPVPAAMHAHTRHTHSSYVSEQSGVFAAVLMLLIAKLLSARWGFCLKGEKSWKLHTKLDVVSE